MPVAAKKTVTAPPTVTVVKKAIITPTAPRRTNLRLEEFALPTESTRLRVGFGDLTWLLYGAKGIGKTSLSARFPGALVAPFEPGTKFLDIPRLPVVTAWEQFLRVVTQLEERGHKYQTIVVDPGNKAYDVAMDYVCRQEGITHPSDRSKDFGKTWKMVSSAFQDAHTRLGAAGLSMCILAHEKTLELETASGKVFSRVVPVMSGATEEYYAGIVDMIGYYHYYQRSRWLQIRGDDYVMAKCRPEQHFLTPSGEPVVRIPMGKNSREAYANLLTAFNDGQEETYAELVGIASTGDEQSPLGRKAYKAHRRAKDKD